MLLNGTYNYDITFEKSVTIDRMSLREDITQGQRVRSFSLLSGTVNSTEITNGTSIGNRRIKLFNQTIRAQELKLFVTAVSAPKLSQIAFFAPC